MTSVRRSTSPATNAVIRSFSWLQCEGMQSIQVKYACPQCGTKLKATMQLDISTTKTETATQITVSDHPPLRCLHCHSYVEVNVIGAELSYEFEAIPTM